MGLTKAKRAFFTSVCPIQGQSVNSLANYLAAKTLFSRNFFQKSVRVNFRVFRTALLHDKTAQNFSSLARKKCDLLLNQLKFLRICENTLQFSEEIMYTVQCVKMENLLSPKKKMFRQINSFVFNLVQ